MARAQNDSVHQINNSATNRPFLFRKDLELCLYFVISRRQMALADWALFDSCVLEMSGCSKSAVRFAVHARLLRLRRALVPAPALPPN
jgi:hypothetical protein